MTNAGRDSDGARRRLTHRIIAIVHAELTPRCNMPSAEQAPQAYVEQRVPARHPALRGRARDPDLARARAKTFDCYPGEMIKILAMYDPTREGTRTGRDRARRGASGRRDARVAVTRGAPAIASPLLALAALPRLRGRAGGRCRRARRRRSRAPTRRALRRTLDSLAERAPRRRRLRGAQHRHRRAARAARRRDLPDGEPDQGRRSSSPCSTSSRRKLVARRSAHACSRSTRCRARGSCSSCTTARRSRCATRRGS